MVSWKQSPITWLISKKWALVFRQLLMHFAEKIVLNTWNQYLNHSGPKMPKSKPWGESPKFICHLNKGHIVISKYKIFFRSVRGNFKQNSNVKVIEFPSSPLRWTVWYNLRKNSKKKTILSTIVSFTYFWLCWCKIKYQTLS